MNQRYGMKRNKSANNLTKNSINSLNKNKYYIGNSKIVANLNQRLYYNEISKKDIDYKILKEKAKQLIDDNSYENNIIMTEKGKNKGKEKLNNNNNNPNIKPKNETNNKLEQNIIKTAQNEIIEKNIRKTSSIKIELDKEKESMAKLEVLDDVYNFNEEEFKKRR